MPLSEYLLFIFIASELILLIGRRSKSSSVKNRKDRGSLLILWLVIPICITSGFLIKDTFHLHNWNHFVRNIGNAVIIAGLLIRWISILQLGKSFTVDVSIQQEHPLKTNGLYHIVRHPSYTGLLLIITGIAITMSNWISLAVVIIPICFAINFRINIEEKVLQVEFGEAYQNYKSKVKKLIPGIY